MFIDLEGLDGCGKTTQTDLVCKRLSADGIDYKKIKLPDYESDSSILVRKYLAGDFGKNAGDVNAYATFNDKSTFNEDATFNDELIANANAKFNWHTDVDTFHAAGQATFWDDVDIDYNLNVDWNAVVEWNQRIDWSLSVWKNSEFKKNLVVKQNLEVDQNVEVTWKVTAAWLEVTNRAVIANEEV